VQIFPNSQLGGEREMAESVKLGTLDMTVVTVDGAMPAAN
jgi:TRAP-type C4-dicarboxylate transport system substrate-binding protein